MSSGAAPHPPVVVLDGGLGTTLEDVFEKDVSSPLWSASMIDKDPDAIVQAHSAFLVAGSDIILTATYQCSFETFERAGYSKTDAVFLMRKAVRLAAQAKGQFSKEDGPISIALSLGPFGATLSPPQEYGGFYPPPYGPRAYSDDGENVNDFADVDAGRASILALAEFHYERLKVFADDGEDGVWSLIDLIAFETVPIPREVHAIRIAMHRLDSDLRSKGLASKSWWISTVWPMDVRPGSASRGSGTVAHHHVAHALLFDHGPIQYKGEVIKMAVPSGIGINCAHVADLEVVLHEMRDSVVQMGLEGMLLLAIYPNGGNTYDFKTRTWIPEEKLRRMKLTPEMWARLVSAIATSERDSGVWRQVMVGGCCKTTPQYIELLASRLQESKVDQPSIRVD